MKDDDRCGVSSGAEGRGSCTWTWWWLHQSRQKEAREMKQARQRAAVQAAAVVWEAAAAVVQEARADEIFSTFRWYVTVYVLYCKGRS